MIIHINKTNVEVSCTTTTYAFKTETTTPITLSWVNNIVNIYGMGF